MKVLIKLLILTLTIITFLVNDLHSQKKTVLLENLVCNTFGNTPATIWHTDSIQKLYYDDIILVRHHVDYSTYYDEWNNPYYDSLGLADFQIFNYDARKSWTPYKIAYLDRKMFKNSSGRLDHPVPRDLYKYLDEALSDPSEAMVSVDWNIDKEERKLFAKLHVILLQSVQKQLRLNLYVVEDSVMGHGLGWDQYNALSGNNSWLPCPYVYEPDTIKNFVHRHVVRKCLGSAFGIKDSNNYPAQIGDYFTHDFQCDIDDRWDIDKLSVVGLVQVFDRENDDYEILNSARRVKKDLPFSISSAEKDFSVEASGKTFSKTFVIRNTSNETKGYEFSISKSERTPDDWEIISFPDEEISLASGETSEITIEFTRSEITGIGDAILEFSVKDDEYSFLWTEVMTLYAEEIKYLSVTDEAGFMEYSLAPIIKEIGRDDIFEVTPEFLLENSEHFPQLKTIIWNTGYILENIDSLKTERITSLFQRGINILLCGFSGALDHIAHYYPDVFEIEIVGHQTRKNLFFSGYEDDLISGFLQEKNVLTDKYEFTTRIGSITNTETTSPFIKFCGDGVGRFYGENNTYYDSTISSDDSFFGVKIKKENAKAVIMWLSPYRIANKDTLNLLMNNMLNWLDGTLDVNDYEENNGRFYLDVFPNPALSEVSIRFAYDDIMPEFIEINLYDIKGNIIQSVFSDYMNTGENTINIDVSKLPAGNYRIMLKGTSDIISCPLVIIR
jgi:hypothetical protein